MVLQWDKDICDLKENGQAGVNTPPPSAALLRPTSPGLLLVSGSHERGRQEPPCSAPRGTGERLQGPGTASQPQPRRQQRQEAVATRRARQRLHFRPP